MAAPGVPDLRFEVEGAEVPANAAVPQLNFKVRVTDSAKVPIQSIALRVQVQIEPVRRRYTAAEQESLKELFGEAERWSQTAQPLLWSNVNVSVPAFDGSATVAVPVPCTFDFNVAVTKYIHGLEGGEIPVSLLFSGTAFYSGRMGLQIAPIPWECNATHRLPVQLWKGMMDLYYPNTAWLCLRRDVFEKLLQFRARRGYPTWEKALQAMLELNEKVKS
jgi:hypothetical protein